MPFQTMPNVVVVFFFFLFVCLFGCFFFSVFTFYVDKMVLLKIVPLLLMGIIGAEGQSGKSTKSRN